MRTRLSFFGGGVLAACLLVAPSGIFADGNGDGQGQDTQTDGRGDRTRQMPPRASASTGAVVQGNGINYHGGPVLHSVNLYYIWYGNWAQDTNAAPILNNFANHIGGTPYFNINTTYGDNSANVPNAVTFVASTTDSGSLGTSLSDANIFTIVSSAISSGKLGPADPNGVYMVLTAPGVAETSGFLSSYCGWHTAGTLNSGTTVQYAFIGDAAGASFGSCAEQTGVSPNGDPAADAMVSVMAHELEESATDPHVNAWYDSSGEENADKCAWTFGTTSTASNGSQYNMTLGTMNYLIQRNWLNANGGLCVQSYTSAPDFSVSVSGSQTVAQGGTSGNYTLTATPSNGFTGTVGWTVTPPSGITASPSTLSGSSATFTLTASANLTAGTYSIPITATSGTLSHSTTATLVVSAPTFSLTITPASQNLTRPGSISYTVNVVPAGGFSTSVSLSASLSGNTTGLSTSLSPTSVAPGTPSKLTVTVTNSAKRNTHGITVTGTSGGVTKTATATVNIQ